MGVIRETADALIREYGAEGYSKYELIQYSLKGFSLKRLRKLTHYFYWKRKIPEDHKDWLFFFRLVAWAIIERSGALDRDKDAFAAMIRHREALIVRGPLSDTQLASNSDSSKKRKRRKRRKQEKDYMAKKSQEKTDKKAKNTESKEVEKKVEKSKKGKDIRIGKKTFESSHKFTLKADADDSKGMRKRGRARIVAMVFKKGKTFNDAVSAVAEEITSGKLKDSGIKTKDSEKMATKFVRGALRRLVRFGLIEGTTSTVSKKKNEKPKKKKDKKDKKDDKKSKKKSKDEEDDDEDDDDDEDKKPKKKKDKKDKKKSKKVEDDEDGDEDGDDDEDEDEDEDEED